MFRNRKYKTPRFNSGQSTVEYIILVAGVIAVLIVFLGPNGAFTQRVNQTLSNAGSDMAGKSEELFTSHTTNAGSSGSSAVTVNVLQNPTGF